MDNLGADHSTGYFKDTAKHMSGLSLSITPISCDQCSPCYLFHCYEGTAGVPSGRAPSLGRDAGCTRGPILHLPAAAAAPPHRAVLCPPSSSLERQLREPCSLQLAWARELYPDWGIRGWWRKGREGTMLTSCPGKLFCLHL